MNRINGFCRHVMVFALLVISFPLLAQREQVNLKTRNAAAMRTFSYHQQSNWDVVNGKLSVALVSANGYVFEINGISTKNLKCKTKLKATQFKVILIDDRNGKTYASSEKSTGTLTIQCLANGEYEFLYSGDIFLDEKKVTINATLRGSPNHSKNLKSTR